MGSVLRNKKCAVSEAKKVSDAAVFDQVKEDEYTIGGEKNAPVGAVYYHVKPKTVKISEESANRLFSVDDDLFSIAKKRFGVTRDLRECGYILPSGELLDFSGRNMGSGEYGVRRIDHREIADLNYLEDLNTPSGLDVSMEKFIRMGAIRVHVSKDWAMFNFIVEPTINQEKVLSAIVRYANGCVDVEIGDGNESYCYGEYDDASPSRVIGDIRRYFSEGIKFNGNISESLKSYPFNEEKMVWYLNALKQNPLNEEVVADGNSEHNPFQKRWKQEREALKTFLFNNGALMTSKENGKQYYVYVDYALSNLIGFSYCICIQWDPYKRELGSTPYIRAYDKFTRRIFKAAYDTRGRDNIYGTYDDLA